jgi:hypothetical protein
MLMNCPTDIFWQIVTASAVSTSNIGMSFRANRIVAPRARLLASVLQSWSPRSLGLKCGRGRKADCTSYPIEHYPWRAIHQASRILEKIDERWPAGGKDGSVSP